MAPIQTTQEFQELLAKAILQMEQLVQKYPTDAFLQSILRQLRYISEWTSSGKKLSQEQIERLSFGVMASRAVDELDQDLAQSLYRLANYCEKLR